MNKNDILYYFDVVKRFLQVNMGLNPDTVLMEASSIEVSAVLTPEAGGIYNISFQDTKRREGSNDIGVAESNMFFGFAAGLFLSKEKVTIANGEKIIESGASIKVPYVDGNIFTHRPQTGIPEFDALMSVFNGSWSIEDQDGAKILSPRLTSEFLSTPQKQYTPFVEAVVAADKTTSAAIMPTLPQYNRDNTLVPLHPMIVLAGNKVSKLVIKQGAGDKRNISGAAGSQNVITAQFFGITVRNTATLYTNILSKAKA